jgi:hypothetical protein
MSNNKADYAEPGRFYRTKGLKRTTITLSDETTEFLEEKRLEFSTIKTTKQGDIVEAFVAAYLNNPEVQTLVDAELTRLLSEKVVKTAGRKPGQKNKAKELPEETSEK